MKLNIDCISKCIFGEKSDKILKLVEKYEELKLKYELSINHSENKKNKIDSMYFKHPELFFSEDTLKHLAIDKLIDRGRYGKVIIF